MIKRNKRAISVLLLDVFPLSRIRRGKAYGTA